ncbi:energy-coupling factor ABC transporter ATP-binding protein [Paenibacillus thermotolerans]|uniref:energy-coupling factor ABC transporter ATP-binding protein n=1 Tax=Paenibacillus thermotolerans TaxID=3027807 RepID=UPI0023682CD1|nr:MULTISPECIES: ATP-binding cassette domain-containing protein [unclassified Paenibacillus]
MGKQIPHAISLENAAVRYLHGSSERPAAIEGISIHIREGSWTAVVGNNGSGKSTLSLVLSGMIPLSEGRRIVAAGQTVHMVMQNPETQILGETVYEEIQLCAAGMSAADMSALLREVGLSVPSDMPIKQLSGGQKQLLNIACCLAAGASCIVFDEATSMLDPASRQSVLEATAKLNRLGRTVLWVTHRMEELHYADRIIALGEGRIVFDGTCEAFFYGEADAARTGACERLGFEPPYVVRAARALQARGIRLPALPLSPNQFSEAVMRLVP